MTLGFHPDHTKDVQTALGSEPLLLLHTSIKNTNKQTKIQSSVISNFKKKKNSIGFKKEPLNPNEGGHKLAKSHNGGRNKRNETCVSNENCFCHSQNIPFKNFSFRLIIPVI